MFLTRGENTLSTMVDSQKSALSMKTLNKVLLLALDGIWDKF
ncbi:hypothetical protein [Leptospira alexanderi]|nr:hypothetical protein [Leptospira alexanderi]